MSTITTPAHAVQPGSAVALVHPDKGTDLFGTVVSNTSTRNSRSVWLDVLSGSCVVTVRLYRNRRVLCVAGAPLVQPTTQEMS